MSYSRHAVSYHAPTRLRWLLRPLALIVGLLAGLPSVTAQTPLLEYRFNETGTSAPSTGANPAAMSFIDANSSPADLHSAASLGVSGLPGDRAFDNTASTAMGGAGTGGEGFAPANILGTFSSFTVECWFNASTVLTGAARLFDANSYVVYASSNGGSLWLTANKSSTESPQNSFNQVNQWVFFAVSYDGTKTTNNVTFYAGTKTTPVTQLGSAQTLNASSVQNNHVFSIGNAGATTTARPFDGYMDDVRVFGSGSDSSGVLTAAQLEAFRQQDVLNVPECSTFSFMLIGALAILWHRRWRSRGCH